MERTWLFLGDSDKAISSLQEFSIAHDDDDEVPPSASSH